MTGGGDAGGQDFNALPMATTFADQFNQALPEAFADINAGATLMSVINDQVKANEEGAKQIALSLATMLDSYLPEALRTTATVILETLSTWIAQRLGIGGSRP